MATDTPVEKNLVTDKKAARERKWLKIFFEFKKMDSEETNMTLQVMRRIAKKNGVTVTTVYNIRKALGNNEHLRQMVNRNVSFQEKYVDFLLSEKKKTA